VAGTGEEREIEQVSILQTIAYIIGGGIVLAFIWLVAGYVREYFWPYREGRK
jgi:hypothetical protein